MSSRKSIYQQFVEANQNMLNCYNEVDQSQFKDEAAAKSSNVCMSEREKVKSILGSNELKMTRIITERIAILRELEKKPRAMNVLMDDQIRYLR